MLSMAESIRMISSNYANYVPSCKVALCNQWENWRRQFSRCIACLTTLKYAGKTRPDMIAEEKRTGKRCGKREIVLSAKGSDVLASLIQTTTVAKHAAESAREFYKRHPAATVPVMFITGLNPTRIMINV